MSQSPGMAIADVAATTLAARLQEILAGLTADVKRLSPTYLYDERGSRLFDEICTLPEYYATRTELTLLRIAPYATGPAVHDFILQSLSQPSPHDH